jgi:uncharacterized membrane protein
MADGVAFCPKCGAPAGPVVTGMPAAAPVSGPVVTPGTSGLQENVAGLLCYVLGWLTGLIFLLIDKRPFVRFHAAQSIVVFGGLTILRICMTFFLIGGSGLGMWWLWSLISLCVTLAFFVAWILLMVMAYQGKWFEVPIAAGIAKSIAGNPKL